MKIMNIQEEIFIGMKDYSDEKIELEIINGSSKQYERYCYRYMSKKELDMYLFGEKIQGKDHTRHARTSSKGVCFLPETVIVGNGEGETTNYTPVDAYNWLSGIVSSDFLVKFGISKKTRFNKSFGIYADPNSPFWDDHIVMEEQCVKSYDYNSLRIVDIQIPEDFGWKWKHIDVQDYILTEH